MDLSPRDCSPRSDVERCRREYVALRVGWQVVHRRHRIEVQLAIQVREQLAVRRFAADGRFEMLLIDDEKHEAYLPVIETSSSSKPLPFLGQVDETVVRERGWDVVPRVETAHPCAASGDVK